MNFDLPKGQSSIIKVIGVGGGGSNAVNHMFSQGIKGVDFIVCNTDSQALDNSPVPHKIQLGSGLTEGLGAGGDPDVGKNSALENIEQIKEILESNTQMVFVTAGMGGGTGTGGAPVIASIAKEMNILTVGIVTIPFSNEGPKRKQQAEEGLDRLRESVDALIIICNDKLREMYGNLTLSTAFLQADNVLATAARGIA
ncbi:MAG: cell division protein FtsZ, partial [Flavobacteriales bacterium]|nr:cell division protein FtsZ [Flavobacteriales bacterium]